MAEDASERVRREFLGKAPELRRALVAELSALLERCLSLTPDENFVLRHIFAYAGYSQDGLHIPVFAALWGGEESYFPAVRLPEDRVRAAAATLRRRGVLKPGPADVIFVAEDAVRALSAAPRRKLVVSIAASLDGFITRREDSGDAEFIKSVDTVLMGRKTYEKALTFGGGFPHQGRRCLVLSRKKKGRDANVEFVKGDLAKLIARLQKEEGQDIFCDGGAEIIHALLKKNLVDSLTVSFIPVLLGDGIPLFKRGRPELRLKLTETRSFPTGLVQLRYDRA